MEHEVIKLERRRKRRRMEVENAVLDQQAKKQLVGRRGMALVGRYLKKEFEGSGFFLGKVVHYDTGLYRVDYDDGDCVDLKSGEVRKLLARDDDFDGELMLRKNKLDELIAEKYIKTKDMIFEGNVVASANAVDKVEACSLSEFSNNGGNEIDDKVDGDADSSIDSRKHVQDQDSTLEVGTPVVLPPQLPPSSINIGVPDNYVSNLLSVYSFLRSFSIRLFLSPFGLDDFVGSLNCTVPTTLLDSIHVALMRVLRRHLEMISSNGSELASKCLRFTDWSLLDTFTWPIYLVQYITAMGYTNGPEWRGLCIEILEKDYYTLYVGRKLMCLQILCDDVLESEELRTEINMREESEAEIDSDAVAAFTFEIGPRRVHPRYLKTSAYKNEEVVEIMADTHGIKLSCNSSSVGAKGTAMNVDADIAHDGNGDECRLCGMDGTLLCCDGCPSAYHSRCIGVSKTFIPEGTWNCPECTINRIGPTITRDTSLKGAEVFGIDSYGQVFLGTCSHLLVLKVSINLEHCFRYYNQNDIPNVLLALHSSTQRIDLYSDICKRIVRYWNIQKDIFPVVERIEICSRPVTIEEDDDCSTPLTLLGKESLKVVDMEDSEDLASCLTESSVENVVVSSPGNSCKEPGLLSDKLIPTEHLGQHANDTSTKQVCLLKNTEFSGQTKVDSSLSSGSVSQRRDQSHMTCQSFNGKSNLIELASRTLGNSKGSYRGLVNGTCVAVNTSAQRKEGKELVDGRGCMNLSVDFLYMGSHFKSHGYVNQYIHGDFAASAAANLAILSSEENWVSSSHPSDRQRKAVSASKSMQTKAFSSAAMRFFWPNSEKKLVEVPRERCGWCLSCKAPVTSKRGCLLNAAASNAIKAAMKVLSGLNYVKKGEGSLPGIAMYVMFMEESLCGLMDGPFRSAMYRKQWRKQLEQATTCSAVKALLLELEENIRIVALSGDWFKIVDHWSVEPSMIYTATSVAGSTQKRGPSERRGRKPSVIYKIKSSDSLKNLSEFNWWRGGMLSKLISHRGILPCSLVKKAARQGGCRKILGVYYAKGSKIPKRSRQFIWRAAVEMSKNASQLALQVRTLDVHVRWSDLVRPEQTLQDGKGPESEASAFRNAFVCDKKIVEDKVIYGVCFGNQSHLPSRVMRNIKEVEQGDDGKEKYWFFETSIPLYLIKPYEENTDKMHLPLIGKPANVLSKLQRRQGKAFRKDIFAYLLQKRDNLDKCSCASCQLDVLLGNAVKCNACQGCCHQQCTISSTCHRNDEVELVITCKQCYHTKSLPQSVNTDESPTSPLLLQGREFHNVVTISKGAKQKCFNQSLASVGHLRSSLERKSTTHGSDLATKSKHKRCSWGLIWKKKNIEDNGVDFRLKNILLKGNSDMSWSGPVCHLCRQPFNTDLMYIRCESCNYWYHAEAVELEESKIFDVVGFKCCRCRRIRSPMCPYLDLRSKKMLEDGRRRTRASKTGSLEVAPDYCRTISGQSKEQKSSVPVLRTNEEVICPQGENLVLPLSRSEQLTGHNPEMGFERDASASFGGPQKLGVRRHMKEEMAIDGTSLKNLSKVELSAPHKPNSLLNPSEESLCPHLHSDASKNGFEEGMLFDHESLNREDMEFEPQTYFCHTELPGAPDDGGHLDEVDEITDSKKSSSLSRDGLPKQRGGMALNNQREPAVSSVEPAGDVVVVVPCRMCSSAEPRPNLTCQICGLWIHSHCSPWVEEESSLADNWSCGLCREWR